MPGIQVRDRRYIVTKTEGLYLSACAAGRQTDWILFSTVWQVLHRRKPTGFSPARDGDDILRGDNT